MDKKPIIFANWKMYKTVEESVRDSLKIDSSIRNPHQVEVFILLSYTSIYAVSQALRGKSVKVGAQNVFWEDSGSYTGEVSPLQLKDAGCEYAMVGHAERREIFGEDYDMIARKFKAVMRHGLIPILCVGESEQERVSGKTEEVIGNQLEVAFGGAVPPSGRFYILYEPVWAIGTGVTPTPQEASHINLLVAEVIRGLIGRSAERARILYGGSVSEENISKFLSMDRIDGVGIGKASLDPENFARLVNACIRD
ncbi:triosephosphate isomerase (TIM) [Candidatus Hakubella thermalkaliphila]|uniref:Triosephosphate isomerase n=1 Tax=Candidatus Hakubella thermalkaliphila TaxID=2754717 RepID=A0A6V8NMW8_9ACTN|nr:triose-phosphate isomerase [Candidatus Hakubella thermalkaliphila]GFP21463.1 triosephosphate isomerase (TIM) [Candidatus Hakubella thermalkaliphila]